MVPYPIKFAPIAQSRIWGGDQLKTWFDEKQDGPIGEYWVLSGHPTAASVALNGEWAGKTLVELTEEYPEAYLGESPQNRFPLLIKFLEATDDLSVQIHPNDEFAQKVEGDYGKTEAWYILDCKEDGQINYGHTFTNRDEYFKAVEDKGVKEYLRYRPIEKDQVIFVPSQTIHALLAGTILIEIQQTSDVTYRVYDWDRVDHKGQSRELHVEKAADVMSYSESKPLDGTDTFRCIRIDSKSVKHEHLLKCPYFTLEKVMVKEETYSMKTGKIGNPDILVVAQGEGKLYYDDESIPLELKRGDAVLIPGTVSKYAVQSDSKIEFLKTYY